MEGDIATKNIVKKKVRVVGIHWQKNKRFGDGMASLLSM